MLGRVRRHSFPCVIARIGPLRLPRRMPAQTLVSLVFGLRCSHRAHGYPRLLGHLLRTRRVPRPRRGRRHPVPSGDGRRHGLPASKRLGPSEQIIRFEAYFTRLARSRTYASPGPLPSRFLPSPPAYPAQGSLPTRLAGLIGRASHPLDDASVFLEGLRTFLSLRTSIAWSHPRTSILARMIICPPPCNRY